MALFGPFSPAELWPRTRRLRGSQTHSDNGISVRHSWSVIYFVHQKLVVIEIEVPKPLIDSWPVRDRADGIPAESPITNRRRSISSVDLK